MFRKVGEVALETSSSREVADLFFIVVMDSAPPVTEFTSLSKYVHDFTLLISKTPVRICEHLLIDLKSELEREFIDE